MRHSEFRFMNRAIPLFPIDYHNIPTGSRRSVRCKIPFIHKINGRGIVKLTDGMNCMTLEVNIHNNYVILEIANLIDNWILY